MDQEASALSLEQINDYIGAVGFVDSTPIIEHVAQDNVIARLPVEGVRLRPGGYIPGPSMMAIVDLVGWCLIFTRIGITPMALTWDLKINFLRPAHGADLIVSGTQHKFGKLCHASFDLYLDGEPDRLVAHATTTYVLPSE